LDKNAFYSGPGYKKYTFVVDLKPTKEDLLANLKKNARTAIRKAEKSGVKAKKVESLEDLRNFYNLHVVTYERTGAKVRPFSYFESFYKNLVLNQLCAFYIALFEGKIIGGVMIVGNKNVAVYGAGASDIEYRQYNPNNLLLWKAILDAKAAGFKYFDLSSVAHPNRTPKEEGIFKFKESFGGKFTEKNVTRIFCSKLYEKMYKWLKKE
ncbi:GNAT family N-acetyltransferase, partial [Candidatus Woesearchaeota archaeon]|nr:GNAT family N-acetyltransferase [Candidatus Woesearchaeota archaeon]